jgi:hypothetical protein
MSKIQEIKDAQLAARKSRDSQTATLLTTIIGEAEMIGKTAGNRESTDAEVLQVLKKFEKNQIENVKFYTERNMPSAVAESKFEIEVINRFLPPKLTDIQVQKDIGALIHQMGLTKEQKSLGKIVPLLKETYGDQFDGQQVSAMFKQMIQ